MDRLEVENLIWILQSNLSYDNRDMCDVESESKNINALIRLNNKWINGGHCTHFLFK